MEIASGMQTDSKTTAGLLLLKFHVTLKTRTLANAILKLAYS